MTTSVDELRKLAATPLAALELAENFSHALGELELDDLFRLLVVLDAGLRSSGHALQLVQAELARRRPPKRRRSS
jgi:hypothetical protein